MDPADGVGQFGGGTLFEEITAGAGVQGAPEVSGTSEGGRDNDTVQELPVLSSAATSRALFPRISC